MHRLVFGLYPYVQRRRLIRFRPDSNQLGFPAASIPSVPGSFCFFATKPFHRFSSEPRPDRNSRGQIGKWFLFPFFAAILTRLLFSRLWSAERERGAQGPCSAGTAVPWCFLPPWSCVFSPCSRLGTDQTPLRISLDPARVFPLFLPTWLWRGVLASDFALPYSRKALLAVTTTARNSPLMLGSCDGSLPLQTVASNLCVRPHYRNACRIPHLTILSRLMSQKAEQKEFALGKLVTNE